MDQATNMFVKNLDYKLFAYDKPLIPAVCIGVVMFVVVLTMCIINAEKCWVTSVLGHADYHKFLVTENPPRCAFMLFEMTNNWDNPQPCADPKTGGVFTADFCEKEEFDMLEDAGIKDAYKNMDNAVDCTDYDHIYLAYYKMCPDVATAIGAGLGYAGLAQLVATILFLQIFSFFKVIKKTGKIPVNPDGSETEMTTTKATEQNI